MLNLWLSQVRLCEHAAQLDKKKKSAFKVLLIVTAGFYLKEVEEKQQH